MVAAGGCEAQAGGARTSEAARRGDGRKVAEGEYGEVQSEGREQLSSRRTTQDDDEEAAGRDGPHNEAKRLVPERDDKEAGSLRGERCRLEGF